MGRPKQKGEALMVRPAAASSLAVSGEKRSSSLIFVFLYGNIFF
jgi:hypothetical protein